MKTFKIINISSNGSFYFCHNTPISLNGKLVKIHKQDDKNFNLNQKKSTTNIDSRYSSYHRKKYLK